MPLVFAISIPNVYASVVISLFIKLVINFLKSAILTRVALLADSPYFSGSQITRHKLTPATDAKPEIFATVVSPIPRLG